MAGKMPYLVGHSEIASLFGVERQTSQKWRTDGVLDDPDLIASGNPYWLLGTVLRLDGYNGREITPERLALYEAAIPGGYRPEDPADLPAIVGSKEAALILGTNEAAIARWRHRNRIADADLRLSGSPLWLLETLLADAEARSRPVNTGEVERLRAGQRAAQKPRGRKATTPSSDVSSDS
ncbi:hypothetical protein ABZW30_23320 [Kitasatospora sp. NPDC004669]|uniref:hypothetical protein n=1 Tax=Kitasatospora sp. NPDC004669 TaxID=3154555 RepID=UPI0033A6A030